MPVEVVPGCGVYISQRQLDAALDASQNSPTQLIRSLMSVFFPPEVLAISSAYGTRMHQALDLDIVQVCIRKLFYLIDLAIVAFISGGWNLSNVMYVYLFVQTADFVQSNFEHASRSCLIDSINDKCANYRRRGRGPGPRLTHGQSSIDQSALLAEKRT